MEPQGVLAEEGGSLDFLLFSPEDIAIFEEAQAAKVVGVDVNLAKVGPRCTGPCTPESLDRRTLSSRRSRGLEPRELSSDIRSPPPSPFPAKASPDTNNTVIITLDVYFQAGMFACNVIRISLTIITTNFTITATNIRIRMVVQVHQDKALYSDIIRTKIHLAATPGLSCLNGSVALFTDLL